MKKQVLHNQMVMLIEYEIHSNITGNWVPSSGKLFLDFRLGAAEQAMMEGEPGNFRNIRVSYPLMQLM